MKNLHIVTAVIEMGAGLALIIVPSAVVKLLLGSPLDAPVAVALGRLAGMALFGLGVACWLACGDTKSRAARGLVIAMMVYNTGAALILGAAGFQLATVGIALWSAVVLHAAMAGWCARVLGGSGKNVQH